MKKIISAIVIVLTTLAAVLPASARVGNVIGQINSADIKAYVNGVQVKAYNIGGRTCIPIEDVTSGYAYNNDFRTLLVHSFDPDIIMEYTGGDVQGRVGDIVGSVYETDIKTYFYDNELSSYNIGGKTCVAIEDLGDDNTFSTIGGKYVWDPVNRTISLDYLYDTENSLLELMSENGLDVNIKITDRAVEFALPTGLWCYSITYDTSEMFESGNRPERPIPETITSALCLIISQC